MQGRGEFSWPEVMRRGGLRDLVALQPQWDSSVKDTCLRSIVWDMTQCSGTPHCTTRAMHPL